MEFLKKANTTATFVFPLITSGATGYYTTSAWTNLTSPTKTLYTWTDNSVPISATAFACNPTQLGSTGEWYISATASEMSGTFNYMMLKLLASEIQEQTILVKLTTGDLKDLSDSSGRVTVISNQDKTNYTVSGYTNFPNVTVSATTVSLSASVRDWLGTAPNILQSGRVDSYVGVNNDKINYSISGTKKLLDNLNDINGTAVTATSIPAVSVGQVTVSAYNNFPQVYVSANGDKTNYNILSNSDLSAIKTQTDKMLFDASSNIKSVKNAIGSTDFNTTEKQSLANACLVDPIGDVGANSVRDLLGSIITQTSATTLTDIIDNSTTGQDTATIKADVEGGLTVTLDVTTLDSILAQVNLALNSVIPGSPTVDSINDRIKRITALVSNPVSVSAYSNFPQVFVSAGNVTNVTGNISGSVNNVVTPISVTVGQVQVSGINANTITSASFATDYYTEMQSLGTSASVSIDYIQVKNANISAINETFTFSGASVEAYTTNSVPVDLSPVQNTVNAISAVTNQFTFSGNNVKSYSTNELTFPAAVTVSAYQNFPNVTVSANLDKTNYSISGTKKLLDNLNDINGNSVTAVSVPQVRISAVNSGVYIGTSAFINVPQVYTSAGTITSVINPVTVGTNNDKKNYTVSSGNIDNVNNPVAVNSYQNFPEVYVSGMSDVIDISATVSTVSEVAVNSITSAGTADILNALIDGKTLSDIMTILLANVVGNVDRTDNILKYYKQDSGTLAFQNTITTTQRRRTD